MRIMGLDVGEKRIGIALSDPMGWTAQGYSVLTRKDLGHDLAEIKKICEEKEVEEIVIGLPRNMNGTLGPKAEEVQKFGSKVMEHTGIKVTYWDERLSTVSAEKVLLAADVSRRRRKEVIDKLAAVNILQNYLDYINRA
ncbi:putative holliday junction resolvase [Thermosyntropha lipolytica DSM 11003]|uniref:Putative pre-16S rRNA nuclease n=1 Tax=Thermosyntropha lipolytica DSM 11003 TaxID=1123382 RepID=A0A1M5MVJ8_9FIRM|nr:Holliday junction resolvase RuvX [Thermosyntropha lipolytica]SHG81217.1 putative holliday junction resolvase [Thermosyntropha lipolytica DSM 11003]